MRKEKIVRRSIRILLLAAIASLAIVRPASAYDASWPRSQGYIYATKGIWERYVYGGSTYRDNNTWDSDEGADCSGFAAKTWAVEHYTGSMTAYHPYSTYSFYNGFPYGVFLDRNNAYRMNTWTYASSTGGPGDHMGLFDVRNSDGTWETIEARGSSYGIVWNKRSLSTLISWNYHRSDRKNWG